jgi:hypothetical protein
MADRLTEVAQRALLAIAPAQNEVSDAENFVASVRQNFRSASTRKRRPRIVMKGRKFGAIWHCHLFLLAKHNVKSVGGKKKLPVYSTVLFNGLLAIVQRSYDMQPLFTYELIMAVPAALFKDIRSLQKADKFLLAKE